jgi:hypothetical protein
VVNGWALASVDSGLGTKQTTVYGGIFYYGLPSNLGKYGRLIDQNLRRDSASGHTLSCIKVSIIVLELSDLIVRKHRTST